MRYLRQVRMLEVFESDGGEIEIGENVEITKECRIENTLIHGNMKLSNPAELINCTFDGIVTVLHGNTK